MYSKMTIYVNKNSAIIFHKLNPFS